MLNFLFRKHHYFVVSKLSSVGEKNNIDPKVFNFIKRYFFWRGRGLQYFEPYSSQNGGNTYMIFGTAQGQRTINRNSLIFLLELFASINDPKAYPISPDFKRTIKTVNGNEILIFKIKK